MLNHLVRTDKSIAAEKLQTLQDSHDRLLTACEAVANDAVAYFRIAYRNKKKCQWDSLEQARAAIEQARKVRTE